MSCVQWNMQTLSWRTPVFQYLRYMFNWMFCWLSGYLCKTGEFANQTIPFIYKYSLINSSLFLSYTYYLIRKIYEQLQCSVEVLIIPTARTRSFTCGESIENLRSYYDAPPILEVFIYFKRCQENFSRHLFKTILVAPKIA